VPPSFPAPTPRRLAARVTRAKELRQGAPRTQPPAFAGREPPSPLAAAAREQGSSVWF
jgi:hypothetical protein